MVVERQFVPHRTVAAASCELTAARCESTDQSELRSKSEMRTSCEIRTGFACAAVLQELRRSHRHC